jgi:hypothetical protein
MTDLSQTIAPKSDQLNSDDLIGGSRTIRITRVSANPDSSEQPISIFFEGDNNKPYKPCKSMRRVLVQVWGKDGLSYTSRAMTLYRDAKVQFGGLAVGGIRISHMSHIENDVTMALTATRANRKPFTVKPLVEAKRSAASGAPDVKQIEEWVNQTVVRIDGTASIPDLEMITADADTIKRRKYLETNYPDLAARVTSAIAASLAKFEGRETFDDPEFPDDQEAA